MNKRAILTSASNKFFPSVLNLIGSIKKRYPDHPPIVVFDLGLSSVFKYELSHIPNITVKTVPAFTPHWKSCYTWKSFIFVNPQAVLNIYLDAGCEVLKPLDELYTLIEQNDFFTVEQNTPLDHIVPAEYRCLIPITSDLYAKNCITAGILGFKNNSSITPTLQNMFDASLAGLCLGFSKNELWRNKGKNKSRFIRNCQIFRHDTTLLSMFTASQHPVHAHLPVTLFDAIHHNNQEQYVWNLRLNYKELNHIDVKTLHDKPPFSAYVNRAIITVTLTVRNIWRTIRKK